MHPNVMIRNLGQTLTSMAHSFSSWIRGWSGGWSAIYGTNNTRINYAASTRAEFSTIVVACYRWIQRAFTEAPPMMEWWDESDAEWEKVFQDDVLDLLERPNPFYSGATLFKAVIADRSLTGTGYIVKVRSRTKRPIELWWAPESTMEPISEDPNVFIQYYQYSPQGLGIEPIRLAPSEVIRLPDGMDPDNPRKGLSPMKSLMREIFTDDEAANMTASLLRNMGVPGVVISPKGDAQIPKEVAEEIKNRFMAKTTGDFRGEPLILQGQSEIQTFGFSPEQMNVRQIRTIPEERITAVIGVPAAVVGLGAGLQLNKVGATLREYRAEAFEGTIAPLYREIASELTHQLVPDFKPVGERWRLGFDLSKVRSLQEDIVKERESVSKLAMSRLIKVSEARRALGFPVEKEHDLWLVPTTVTEETPDMVGNPPDQPASPGQQQTTAGIAQQIEEILRKKEATV